MNFNIEVTEDYEGLVPFFIEQGLEFSEDEPVPTDIAKCWVARTPDGELAGAFVLAERDGEFIVDGIAAAPFARGCGLGRRLLVTGIEEAKRLGGNRLFLVARAPGFFAKQGFYQVKREEAPEFFECFTCPQYGVTCSPQVMAYDMRDEKG